MYNIDNLQFTGNWFIDAGILGFVNLMEEVYGWDLDELQKRIKDNAEDVYYWYFPVGYVCHIVREVQTKEGLEKRKLIDNIISKIPEAPQIMNKKDLFEKAWKWITSNKPLISETKRGKSKIRRIKMSWSGRYRIFTNFPLFQPRYNLEKQKNIFMGLLGLKEIEDEVLMYIDKATSKFLPSASDFPNISYTKSCITMKTLLSLNIRAPMFILTYPLAFVSETLNLLKYQILFYSPDLTFTYSVGKKLKMYLKKAHKKENRINIFNITWEAIINSISELESLWSLENMYLIKIKPPTGQKQDLDEVEYIGIPKLQAGILLEDPVRESLNINLQMDDNDWKWILEEFIKNKPLHPLILRHVQYCINKNKMVNRKTSLYALVINAKIKENNSIELFSSSFLKGYRSIVEDIKETYRNLSIQATNISKLFDSREDRQKTCYSLMVALKRRNKIAFTNILLKKFLEKSGLKEISYLNRFVFDKIMMKDASWENYALALVVGIWSFGGEDDGESDLEE